MSKADWKLGETILMRTETGAWNPWTVRERLVEGLNIADVDGRVRWVPESELRTMFARRALRRQRPADAADPLRKMLGKSLCSFSEEERAEVRAVAPYVVEYRRRGIKTHASKIVLSKLIADVAAERGDVHPPAWRTLSDKLRLLKKDNTDGRVLLSGRARQGNKEKRFKAFEKELDEVVRTEVLKPVPMPVVALWSLLQAKLEAFNLSVRPSERVGFALSRRTVERRIAALPVNEKVSAWEGKAAARRRCMPTGKASEADFPMEFVEIDHTVIDLVVVHPRTRKPVGRPVLTVMLDRYSRMVVGAVLGFEPPGYAAVMQCMRQAIMPKDALLERYGLPADGWPSFGLLHCIVVDNASEFHSAMFDDACSQLLVDRRWCRTGTPSDKGQVERFIGTMNRALFHTLPGTTFSNTEMKGDYDPEGEACLDLGQVRELMYGWLVREYFVEHHSGIDCSPRTKFLEGLESRPLAMPCEPEDLDVLLMPGEPRTLQRQGISMHGTWYGNGHPELARLLNDPGKPAKCVIKEDRDDLGHVYLLDWTCGRYLELACLEESGLSGATKHEWEIDSELARRARSDGERLTHAQLRDARVERFRKTRELEAAGKIRGRKAGRLSGADPDAPARLLPAPVRTAAPMAERPAVRSRSLAALGITLEHVG